MDVWFSIGATLGRQKFLFYFFSGVGAATLQMAAYAFQFHSVTEVLNTGGFTTTEVIDTIALGRLNEDWLGYVTREQVLSAYNVYVGSMVGASGALYGVLVAFAFLSPMWSCS